MFGITTVLTAALVLLVASPVAGFSFRVSVAPDCNQMFQRTNGWIGADLAYSVPLGRDKTLWLFGDTFVGRIEDGKRASTRMIHSSIAVQWFGREPHFDFYYPVNKRRAPQSFIKSPGLRTYFWLSDGARTDQGLYFFMQEIKWINDSTWGFQCVGTWLAFVDNPDATPALWKISTRKLPYTWLPDGQVVVLGGEILETPNYIYIYGYSNRTNSSAVKNLLLARAPQTGLGNTNLWEFYSDGGWTKSFDKSTSLLSGAGAEGSVSWQPFLQKFVYVYSDGLWGSILMRTAETPEGPWGPPIKLYQCPDTKISPHVFCYAAKGHPELSATNELIVSYAANSDSLSEVMNDTRLYWPRFIRVTFESHNP